MIMVLLNTNDLIEILQPLRTWVNKNGGKNSKQMVSKTSKSDTGMKLNNSNQEQDFMVENETNENWSNIEKDANFLKNFREVTTSLNRNIGNQKSNLNFQSHNFLRAFLI